MVFSRSRLPSLLLTKALLVSSILVASVSVSAAFNTNPPTTGAMTSGIYRDIASELGKTDGAAKRTAAWNAMFVTAATKLYTTYGTDKAYIYTPDSDDIRTEGQSWGMTAAVMMNKQAEFDKLWLFAAAHQRNTNGTFKWQLRNVNGTITTLDGNPAPDGELYFAFALLNADARWGSTGSINYYNEGVAVLNAIKNSLMSNNIIVFSPNVANVFDPSYQIPAFYDYFAKRVTSQSDKDYWTAAAASARTFLQNHMSTAPAGLPTYLAASNGSYLTGNAFTGAANPSQYYEADAWRVAMNIGLDAHMTGAKTWHKTAIDTILYFLKDKHNTTGCYMQKYEYGTPPTSNNYCADVGQKSTNAAGLLSSTNASDAAFFIDQLWATSFPSGTYRYYHGALYMLGLLHVTGEFKFHLPNKLANGTFNTNINSWYSNVGGSGAATSAWQSGGTAKVTITAGGANVYDVQFSQNTSIKAGKSYKLEFDARITQGTSRTIGANLEKQAAPYTNYGSSTHSIGTTMKRYTTVFTAVSANDNAARLVFQLGANANDVAFDNVTLVEL